jgi:hypothetical protein
MGGSWEGDFRCELAWLRIIYSVDQDGKWIDVSSMGPRGDVYQHIQLGLGFRGGFFPPLKLRAS